MKHAFHPETANWIKTWPLIFEILDVFIQIFSLDYYKENVSVFYKKTGILPSSSFWAIFFKLIVFCQFRLNSKFSSIFENAKNLAQKDPEPMTRGFSLFLNSLGIIPTFKGLACAKKLQAKQNALFLLNAKTLILFQELLRIRFPRKLGKHNAKKIRKECIAATSLQPLLLKLPKN